MKDLIIGTNSAVEALETGGVGVGCSSGNCPSKGAMDRASKVDVMWPITRHQCLVSSDESSA